MIKKNAHMMLAEISRTPKLVTADDVRQLIIADVLAAPRDPSRMKFVGALVTLYGMLLDQSPRKAEDSNAMDPSHTHDVFEYDFVRGYVTASNQYGGYLWLVFDEDRDTEADARSAVFWPASMPPLVPAEHAWLEPLGVFYPMSLLREVAYALGVRTAIEEYAAAEDMTNMADEWVPEIRERIRAVTSALSRRSR